MNLSTYYCIMYSSSLTRFPSSFLPDNSTTMYILVWKEGQQIQTFQDLEECGQFQTSCNITDGQIFSVTVTPTMSKGGESGEQVLRRLMYLSKSTEPEACDVEYLADLAGIATSVNKHIGVSGFLLYSIKVSIW